MRISDWSSDVCSSDLGRLSLIDNQINANTGTLRAKAEFSNAAQRLWPGQLVTLKIQTALDKNALVVPPTVVQRGLEHPFVYRIKGDQVENVPVVMVYRSEEHTSELQSLMRISYAVFCLNKQKYN